MKSVALLIGSALILGCSSQTKVVYQFKASELEKEDKRWIAAGLYPSIKKASGEPRVTIHGNPYELRIFVWSQGELAGVDVWGHGVSAISNIEICDEADNILYHFAGGKLVLLEHNTVYQIKDLQLDHIPISLRFNITIEEDNSMRNEPRTINFEPVYWSDTKTPSERFDQFIDCPLGCV